MGDAADVVPDVIVVCSAAVIGVVTAAGVEIAELLLQAVISKPSMTVEVNRVVTNLEIVPITQHNPADKPTPSQTLLFGLHL